MTFHWVQVFSEKLFFLNAIYLVNETVTNVEVLTRRIQYQYKADLVDNSKLKRDTCSSGSTFVLLNTNP